MGTYPPEADTVFERAKRAVEQDDDAPDLEPADEPPYWKAVHDELSEQRDELNEVLDGSRWEQAAYQIRRDPLSAVQAPFSAAAATGTGVLAVENMQYLQDGAVTAEDALAPLFAGGAVIWALLAGVATRHEQNRYAGLEAERDAYEDAITYLENTVHYTRPSRRR